MLLLLKDIPENSEMPTTGDVIGILSEAVISGAQRPVWMNVTYVFGFEGRRRTE